MGEDDFVQWFEALEKRHLSNLSFAEVRRSVEALSSSYIERRTNTAFSGAGKRAAFSLFFGPLHFLLVREIVRALGAGAAANTPEILDIGCGTGVAGAAWALEMRERPKLLGIDRNPWALQECKWTYGHFGLRGRTRSMDLDAVRVPAGTAVIAAFTVNELDPAARARFRDQLLNTAGNGAPLLVIEPIARGVASWWNAWARDWIAAGGRSDEWRFQLDLPDRLALMDRAAGLDHRELTGRSLWISGL